jgi:hypothetical protein
MLPDFGHEFVRTGFDGARLAVSLAGSQQRVFQLPRRSIVRVTHE